MFDSSFNRLTLRTAIALTSLGSAAITLNSAPEVTTEEH